MTIFKAFSNSDILNELEKDAPNATIKSDAETLKKYQNDAYGLPIDNDNFLAIVEASDVADVQGVLKVARKYHCQWFHKQRQLVWFLVLMPLTMVFYCLLLK